MKNSILPGFSAEATLYRSIRCYHSAISNRAPHMAQVSPQACRTVSHEECYVCRDYEYSTRTGEFIRWVSNPYSCYCQRIDNVVCDPPGGGGGPSGPGPDDGADDGLSYGDWQRCMDRAGEGYSICTSRADRELASCRKAVLAQLGVTLGSAIFGFKNPRQGAVATLGALLAGAIVRQRCGRDYGMKLENCVEDYTGATANCRIAR